MSIFPTKHFENNLYEFLHLRPRKVEVPLDAAKTKFVDMHVTFGCHCFTESFVEGIHQDHHRYTHEKELRAFDLARHECSLQLPQVILDLLQGWAYDVLESFTYEAQITLASKPGGAVPYSIFFSLEKDKSVTVPALIMFVKSAYERALVARANTERKRFRSLAGQISGAFPAKSKPARPQPKKKKKKAP